MENAGDFSGWCCDEDVMVQLATGHRYMAVAASRDTGGIVPATLVEKNEKGELYEVAVPHLPILIGRLRVKGTLLELTYRVDERHKAVVSLHPRDVQHVSKIETARIVT